MRLTLFLISILTLAIQDTDPLRSLDNMVVDLSEASEEVRYYELSKKPAAVSVKIRKGWFMALREDISANRIDLPTHWRDFTPNYRSLAAFKKFAVANSQWKGSCLDCSWGEYKEVWFVVKQKDQLMAFKGDRIIIDH